MGFPEGRDNNPFYLRARALIPPLARSVPTRGDFFVDLSTNSYVHVSRASYKLPSYNQDKEKDRIWVFQAPLWGTHSPPIPQWLNSPKPGSLSVGVKKSQLSSTRRVTVPRRLTGEKKNNSMFQNCWACCYGNEPCPHLHLFSLTVLSGLSLPLCGRRFFSFSYFSLLFPHNGGWSQTPSVFLSQQLFWDCGAGSSCCEEVWARPEAEKLKLFKMA